MQDSNIQNEQPVSISALLFILKNNIFIMMICAFISLIIVGAYGVLTLPQYTASGSILIDKSDSKDTELFSLATGTERNMITNQVEILKSKKIAEKSAESLFTSDYKGGLYLLQTRDENIDIAEMPIQALRKILLLEINYFSTLDDVINNYGSKHRAIQSISNKIRRGLVIGNSRGTDIITLQYTSNNAGEAALIVNTIIQSYQEQDISWQNDEHAYLQDFLQKQLIEKKDELSIIEKELKNFQEKTKIFAVNENSRILLEKLQLSETNFYQVQTELNIINEKEKYYKNQLSTTENRFADNLINTIDTQLFALRQELSILESEYATIKIKKELNSLAIQDIQNKINSLKEAIRTETSILIKKGMLSSNPVAFRQSLIDELIQINASKNSLIAEKKQLKKLVSIYNKKLENLPSQFLTLSKLQRDKVILDGTYSLMKRKFEESRISEASELGKITVIDYASPIIGSNWPPSVPFLLLLSIIMMIVLSSIAIAVKEFFDSTIKSFDYIENKGISIIGLIPSFKQSQKGRRAKKIVDIVERPIIVTEDSKSPVAEAYRAIRTALNFSFDTSNSSQSIIISSVGPQEGKSTTSVNIAATFAQLGKKTVILDMDMRKPVMHKIFNLDKTRGFTTAFIEKISLKEAIFNTEIENLKVLPCGPIPPNPSEIIGSEQTKKLIGKLKEQFEIIIVDTPPIIAVADTTQLLSLFDQLLLVVRSGKTQKGAFERIIKNLNQAGYTLKNCVFNDVSSQTSYGGDYYYNYNYYEYYYNESKK
jgi:tyrosine-protein kinase Etk/Wzc